MPKERPFGPRFTRWPREAGLGYSFKQGALRGSLQPEKHGERIEWRLQLWVENAMEATLTTLWGETPWEAIEALEAHLEEETAP